MRFKGFRGLLATFLAAALAAPAFANHIIVGTPTITGVNITDDYAIIQFDLSWENSFRDDINWDAAWVFVKYKETGGDWHHAYLNTTAGNHIIPAGYTCSVGLTEISSVDRGMGVFIYRSSNGSGNTNLASVQLRWEYGANGLADGAAFTVKVFAIEMVYIPQGAFYVGDADADQPYCFYEYGTSGPYQITSEGTIDIGETNGYLWAKDDGHVETSTLPADFPKGHAAFYCMKYEISQGQYVDFLNTLTATQDGTRFPNENGNYRHTIGGSSGSRSAGVEDRACNYLSWMDGAAYADWAGLRPMTELEFEKACRGTQVVVDDEFAWGNTSITEATTITGPEDGTETVNGNCNYIWGDEFSGGDDSRGPLRCGIFATGSSTRAEAGASYYSVMEMSGNLWEQTVSAGRTEGMAFTGTPGDGALSADGNATNADWPDGTSWDWAIQLRGGGWQSFAIGERTSARFSMDAYDKGEVTLGFRCVRSTQ